MSAGTLISGAGHAALIAFLVVGWGFGADPLDFEVTEVSVITGEEFQALTSRPEPVENLEEPTAPAPPAIEEVAPPPVGAAPPPPSEVPAPPPVDPPPAEDVPVIEETDALPPPPEPAVEPVPQLIAPEPPSGAPDLTVSARPRPRPAPRVAPEAAPPPPPEAEVSDVVQDAAVPDAPTEEVTEEIAEDSTAPEAAAPEIVTEAEQPAGGAPTSSIRPAARPSRPRTPQSDGSEIVADSDNTSSEDAVADAIADVVADSANAETSAPKGPPLSGSEREGFRVAVQGCWNVDVGSTSSSVTVTVAFNLTRQGRVDGEVRLVGAEGGDSAAQTAAYQAARRAVLRCQSDGYPLPAEKYEQWKEVEMTFDPSGMRLR